MPPDLVWGNPELAGSSQEGESARLCKPDSHPSQAKLLHVKEGVTQDGTRSLEVLRVPQAGHLQVSSGAPSWQTPQEHEWALKSTLQYQEDAKEWDSKPGMVAMVAWNQEWDVMCQCQRRDRCVGIFYQAWQDVDGPPPHWDTPNTWC